MYISGYFYAIYFYDRYGVVFEREHVFALIGEVPTVYDHIHGGKN